MVDQSAPEIFSLDMKANARALAARAVNLVITQGRSLEDALAQVLAAGVHQDTPLIHEIAYGTIRHYFALSAILSHFLRKPIRPKDADLKALLLIGAYQLLHMRVGSHAAVDQTVEAADALGKEWAKGLVNGVLRSLLRGGPEEWHRLSMAPDEARFNHPAWLLTLLQTDWPSDWESICRANDTRAPMTLRVNVRKISPRDYLAKLATAGIAAAAGMADSAITLMTPVSVNDLPGFLQGEVSVQDEAAQYAGHLLGPVSGERILDACAAPGGKAAHVLELADVELLAIDIDSDRLERVKQNFSRLCLPGATMVGDAGESEKWWDGRPFDRIVLDAPCSGTGVIRRHPDIKLLRRPADITRLAETQARLLDALWPLLKTGGKLLYATCSILRIENDDQVAAFLAARRDARALPVHLPGGRVQSAGCQVLPGERGMDGFYYAYLEKQ